MAQFGKKIKKTARTPKPGQNVTKFEELAGCGDPEYSVVVVVV